MNKDKTELLLTNIVQSVENKKGDDIVSIDFSKTPNSVAKYFIICSANSKAQVDAIVDEIKINAKKLLNENAIHTEGLDNKEWVLIDYFDVVVHVFQPSSRQYYQIEKLWADVPQKQH
ncbi:MAG: ribosome silencing factor [Bacteroidales bacterium]|jgi:ribosome-associated protein